MSDQQRRTNPPRAQTWIRERLHLLAPILVAAIVFAIAIASYPAPPMIHDAYSYNAAAYRLATTGVYSYGAEPDAVDATPNARVTPGQILLLTAAFKVTGTESDYQSDSKASMPVWRSAQFLFALLTVLFMALAGEELGGTRLALVTGLAGALYVPFAWASSVALSESMGVMLAAAQLWLALRITSQASPRTWRSFAVLGIVSALAAMARPALVAWMAVPLAYMLVRRLETPRRALLLCAVAALGFVLVFVPWWVRNANVVQAFVPLRTDTVLIDGVAQSEGWAAPAGQRTLAEKSTAAVRSLGMPWVPPFDVLWENHFHFDESRVDFGEYPESLLDRFLTWRSIWTWYQSALAMLGVIGVALLVRRSPRLLIVASVPAYAIAVHWGTQISDRYTFLAMPAVLILGSVTAYSAAMKLRARSQPASGKKR